MKVLDLYITLDNLSPYINAVVLCSFEDICIQNLHPTQSNFVAYRLQIFTVKNKMCRCYFEICIDTNKRNTFKMFAVYEFKKGLASLCCASIFFDLPVL